MSLLNVNKIAPSTGTDVALGDASDTFTVAASATLKADTIAETTSANGVTIDGVSLKDSVLNTAGCVTFASLSTSATETINVKQRVAKAWVLLNGSSFGITDDFNIASATDNGTGDYTLTIDTDFANANYCSAICPAKGTGDAPLGTNIITRAVGSLRIETARDDSTKTDCQNVNAALFGDS